MRHNAINPSTDGRFHGILPGNARLSMSFASMKNAIALLLLIAPWAIFVYAAQTTGATSTLVLILTLAVSAVGFTMLISGGKK